APRGPPWLLESGEPQLGVSLGGGGVRADAIDLGNEHHLRGATRRVLLLREEGVQHGREELAGALRVLRPEDPLERLLHPGLEEEGVDVLLERLFQLGEGEVFRYRRQALRLTDLGRRCRRWKRDALTRALLEQLPHRRRNTALRRLLRHRAPRTTNNAA